MQCVIAHGPRSRRQAAEGRTAQHTAALDLLLQQRMTCRYAAPREPSGDQMRISRRNFRLCCLYSAVLLAGSWGQCNAQSAIPPTIPGQNPNSMQVYLRAGLKTHGPGDHDYRQFLADWSKLLTEHGAVVDGSLPRG